MLCVSTPQWDLPLVLEALRSNPYEPLEQSSLKMLSLKTTLLLALTSAKRVSELCALSVHPSYMGKTDPRWSGLTPQCGCVNGPLQRGEH